MTELDNNSRKALEQIAEVKRVLVAIEHALKGNRPTTILCTSATTGEGKSLLMSSLATTSALMGQSRAILIDLNWYRPAIHRFFGVELMHPLERFQNADLADLALRPDGYELDVLLAPTDHETHERTSSELLLIGQRLIEQAKERYDLVLIDGGAIFPTNRMMMDPVMLARMVDGVIMVVMSGVTARQSVKKACKALEISGVNIIGAVTNQRGLSKNH
ncbi:ATPase involved in chromosome partitioning-like protein [Thiorhodococcus drewsii AZ1]|uniref:ATPase involved in chromosome partitioning-like protein n=1 Tax=Thiorhodococcus drewsii AZ1 TaxID=765913 RepID=G2E3L5_9GAMM|nr:CpsD/CapB family tyrosine-protein kinase [Thiorhodococcus drewsii]EGV30128.1 ATPase involved in chromosome partitioning-like protein [Thiorhodococcus drewsii AZ1]